MTPGKKIADKFNTLFKPDSPARTYAERVLYVGFVSCWATVAVTMDIFNYSSALVSKIRGKDEG